MNLVATLCFMWKVTWWLAGCNTKMSGRCISNRSKNRTADLPLIFHWKLLWTDFVNAGDDIFPRAFIGVEIGTRVRSGRQWWSVLFFLFNSAPVAMRSCLDFGRTITIGSALNNRELYFHNFIGGRDTETGQVYLSTHGLHRIPPPSYNPSLWHVWDLGPSKRGLQASWSEIWKVGRKLISWSPVSLSEGLNT